MKSGAKYLLIVVSFLAVTLLSVGRVAAVSPVVVNEFVANPVSGESDWIELYNNSSATVSLNGWYVRDLAASNLKTFAASDTIPAGGYVVVPVNTRLGNTGDTIELYSPSGLADAVSYPADVAVPTVGKSAGRATDGSGAFKVFDTPTKGASNNPVVPTYGELRVHAVKEINTNTIPDFNAGEPHQAGIPIRVYRVTNAGWQYVTAGETTGKYYLQSLRFTVETGAYAICMPQVEGYEQSFARTITGWYSFPNTATANLSGISDEYEACVAVEVKANTYSSHVFGLR